MASGSVCTVNGGPKWSAYNRRPETVTVIARSIQDTQTLYHFTNLISLPSILKEGITRGEVPIEKVAYKDRPQAPNLTRNPLPLAQRCWTKVGPTDKTRVRLTLSLPHSTLTTFKDVRKKYRLRSKWVKFLAPGHEHFDWFFAFGGVSTSQIVKVEVVLEQPGEYVEVKGEQLEALINLIEAEKRKLFITRIGGMGAFELLDESQSCLLIDGPCVVDSGEYPAIPSSSMN